MTHAGKSEKNILPLFTAVPFYSVIIFYVFLVIVIGINAIIFNILDSTLKFSGKRGTGSNVDVNPDQ
jgi:hypothetical protein